MIWWSSQKKGRKGYDDEGDLLYNQRLLQEYILLCAQTPGGGLRDKPSKLLFLLHDFFRIDVNHYF